MELKIDYVPIDSISPYENNAKKHPREQIEQIKASMQEFGNIDPIGIWHGEIVEGHGRYEAAKRLGYKTVPVIRLDNLTDEQRRAYGLVHNQLTMSSGFDAQALEAELKSIADIDMAAYGFGVDEFLESHGAEEAEECEPESIPAESRVKVGDVWQLGNHRLMCGDATNVEHVERLMDGNVADLVFTDPPYNVDYAEKNKFLNGADRGNRVQTDITNDNMESDEDARASLWEPAFKNMAHVADEYCSIYVTMPQGGAHMMMMMMAAAASWQVKHELVWVKNNHVLGRTDYYYKHEPILFGWKDKHRFYGNGEFNKSVWEIDKPQKSDLHPTMKPVRLVVNAIMNSTKLGDIVLDVFGGSGTTIIACEQTERRCRMMELTPEYCDVIIDRWEKLTGKRAVMVTC